MHRCPHLVLLLPLCVSACLQTVPGGTVTTIRPSASTTTVPTRTTTTALTTTTSSSRTTTTTPTTTTTTPITTTTQINAMCQLCPSIYLENCAGGTSTNCPTAAQAGAVVTPAATAPNCMMTVTCPTGTLLYIVQGPGMSTGYPVNPSTFICRPLPTVTWRTPGLTPNVNGVTCSGSPLN